MLVRLFSRRFLTFLFVGGSATALQFVLLIVLVEAFGANKVAASATSYLFSAVYNYLLNYHLTFQSQQSHWQTLPKFVGVVVVGVVVNTVVFAATLTLLPYVVAQCCAIGAALITNFLLHKYWIYRREQ